MNDDLLPPLPSPSRALPSRFKRGRSLGKGSFAEVVLASDEVDGGKEYAMKIINTRALKPTDEGMLSREIDIMKEVQHPNCVRLFNVFESETQVVLQMELARGGELLNLVGSTDPSGISEATARAIVRSVCSALEYLHEKGIAHRDLKLENIMLRESVDVGEEGEDEEGWEAQEERARKIGEQVMIGDFGLSNWMHGSSDLMRTQVGTFAYMAPEVLANKSYNAKCDMWSLGCIAYLLLSGFFPFGGEDNATLHRRIRTGRYELPPSIWAHVSSEARDFIARLLTVQPARRMSAEQALKHPWMAVERTPRPTMRKQRCETPVPRPLTPPDNDSEIAVVDEPVVAEVPVVVAPRPVRARVVLPAVTQERTPFGSPEEERFMPRSPTPARSPSPAPRRKHYRAVGRNLRDTVRRYRRRLLPSFLPTTSKALSVPDMIAALERALGTDHEGEAEKEDTDVEDEAEDDAESEGDDETVSVEEPRGRSVHMWWNVLAGLHVPHFLKRARSSSTQASEEADE